jgi:hypothetical protein
MKIVILAERAAEAGLTQEAAFPMMKNQSLAAGRWSFAVWFATLTVEYLTNDQRLTANDGSYAHRLP